MTTKICRKCLEDKPLADFNRKDKNADGLNSRCRPCVAVDYLEYRTALGEQHTLKNNAVNLRINNESLKTATNGGQRWSKEEEDFVREFWATETSVNIAKALGRSYQAVNNRSFILGLRKRADTYLTETS